jgi:hypothetical protein
MLIKLPDGTQSELVAGSRITLTSPVFGDEIGLGPFEVLEFVGEVPVIVLFISGSGDQKTAPVDIGLIASVDNVDPELTEVTLSDGTVVLINAKVAPAIQAVVTVNQALEKALAELYSGDAIRAALAERDAANALAKEALTRIKSIDQAIDELGKSVETIRVAING